MTRMRITAERQTSRLTTLGGDDAGTSTHLVWSADCPTCGDRAGSIVLADVHRWAEFHAHGMCTPPVSVWRKR